MKKYSKPELVSPAGDWSAMRGAVESGADSVYFGVKGLNMRASASNFDAFEMKKIMKYLHDAGKKGYLTLNVVVFDDELPKIKKILRNAADAKVDGVVLWDTAVLKLASSLGLNVHLSTQASVANYDAVKFYSSLGVKRIVLARECSLVKIKNIIDRIKKDKLKCSVEVFIHGAMCVSISGRCFMSQVSFGKSANRGECVQPCRREYTITDEQDGLKYVIGKDYVLSPNDVCAVGIIDDLIKIGVSAFKIEGRTRAPEYVKVVTAVYREAIDAFFDGRLDPDLKKKLYERLGEVYNRGLSSGFYLGEPDGRRSREPENIYEKVYLGEVVTFYKKIGVASVRLNNGGLKIGDEILIYGNTTPAGFIKVDGLEKDHTSVRSAQKGQEVAIKVPFVARPHDKVFIWRNKLS